jgi:hypothetical protein
MKSSRPPENQYKLAKGLCWFVFAVTVSSACSLPAHADIKCPVRTPWGTKEELCPHLHSPPPSDAGQLIRSEGNLNSVNQKYGAIARSVSSGKYGWSYNYDTQQSAQDAAIQRCGSSDCRVTWFKNAFGAMAEARDTTWSLNWGYSKEQAEQNSLQSCQRNSGQPATCGVILIIDSRTGVILRR